MFFFSLCVFSFQRRAHTLHLTYGAMENAFNSQKFWLHFSFFLSLFNCRRKYIAKLCAFKIPMHWYAFNSHPDALRTFIRCCKCFRRRKKNRAPDSTHKEPNIFLHVHCTWLRGAEHYDVCIGFVHYCYSSGF